MGISNAYCKKHDELEPEDNTGMWVCPTCSKDNMKAMSVKDENGKTPLDRALEAIAKEDTVRLRNKLDNMGAKNE